ncbi:MAG: FKBP-type peptidylprolyl isomerase [Flavobacterium sp.]|nr:FKBP-type peptidylprolyl isomerase [Flavobacterium sp.]
MNVIQKLFSLLFLSIVLVGCERDDDIKTAPLRDHQQQYDAEIVEIERYLKTHTITVVENPGFPDDQNVTFTPVPLMDPTCIWLDSRLITKDVVEPVSGRPYYHDVAYKLYYLKLREGGGALGDKLAPSNVDAVLTSYSGRYLFNYDDPETTDVVENEQRTYEFESIPFPQSNLSLEGVIKGWSEVFPEFKPGDFTTVEGQPVTYTDFGAGVVFIPSGLGYFGQNLSAIPAYSTLIFNFKIYDITRLDHDGDGIPSWLEDINGDGYIRALGPDWENPDDTDGDLAPDYLDLDDDGDQVLTRTEIRRPLQNPEDENEVYTHYSFNGAATDDLSTPYDDTWGIPSCSGDYLSPDRLRKHRDPNCQ